MDFGQRPTQETHFGSAMNDIISILQTIAKANDEKFHYYIDVIPLANGKLRYQFNCEDADKKVFVCGVGNEIESAVAIAMEDIPRACERWQYVIPLVISKRKTT
jgi:hypothetical protein